MPISDKSKLEMRNQNYKQNEKNEMNGKETVKKQLQMRVLIWKSVILFCSL